MRLNERYRKCPIKFYKNEDGSIYYEAPFINGTAKDLNDAFKVFSEQDWEYDLLYYYDDVIGVQFGNFEPALKDLKKNGRVYLGKINLELDITDYNSEHTIKHLATNPQDIPKHQKFIKDLKDKRKRQEFLDKLKQGFKRIAGALIPVHEMFDPIKTREDLICSHCGEIIPKGAYYEEYQGRCYHLECIWDKLYGEKSKDYMDCREFFFSLQKYIGNWPVTLDIEDDYLIDLEFVKSNDRRLGITEEAAAAAMYKSNQPTFKDFYNYVIKNPKAKGSYYEITNPYKLRIPSDTILHDYNKHQTTYEQWDDALSNLENIQNAGISNKKISNNEMALLRILGFKDYGMTIMLCRDYNIITTLFSGNTKEIDNWIKIGSRPQNAIQPTNSFRPENPDSVVLSGLDPHNIIKHITQKIKG